MNKSKCILMAAIAAVSLAAFNVMPAISADAPASANSTDMTSILRQMASDNAALRKEAMDKLGEATIRDFQQTMATQKLLLQIQNDLATQLRTMTHTAEANDDAQAGVAGILEANYALSRWGIEVLALPKEQREPMLEWGLKKENVLLVAGAYARTAENRAQAARDLAAQPPSAPVTWLLLQLLRDSDRAVSLITMETISDRKPEPAIIDALWERASYQMQNQVRQMQRNTVRARNIVTAMGRQVSFGDGGYNNNLAQDPDAAVTVLLHYNDPSIKDKLNSLFKDLVNSTRNGNNNAWRLFTPNYSGGTGIFRLIQAFKPSDAVPFFARALDQRFNDGNGQDTTQNVDGQQVKFHMSTRTDAAILLIRATEQDPETYGFRRLPNYGNDRWGVQGTGADETEAVKKLQAWWTEHAKDYPSTLPPPTAGASDLP